MSGGVIALSAIGLRRGFRDAGPGLVSSSFCLSAVALATPAARLTVFRGTDGAGFACTVFGGARVGGPSESDVRPPARFSGIDGGFFGFGG